MKGLFQGNNRIYCLTNIFVCLLCTGYLCTGYCSINSEPQQQEESVVATSDDIDPLSARSELKELGVEVVKESTTKKVVVTASKKNTASVKYVKPNYDKVTGSAVVNYAKNYLGLRYVSGGYSLTKGTDCSGFTKLIFREFGINLSRSVKEQVKNGQYVSKSDLQKGDLIFYGYKSGVVSHVAIYIGDGKVIHQSTPKSGVKINTMNMMVYITARRVITKPATIFPSEEVKDNIIDVSNEETNKDDTKNDNNTTNDVNNTNNKDNVIESDKVDDNTTNDTNDNSNISDNNSSSVNNKTDLNNNYTDSEYEK